MAAAYIERRKQLKRLGKYIKRLKSSRNEEKRKFGFHLDSIYKKLNSNNNRYHYYLISRIYKLLKTGEYKIYFKKMRLYCGKIDKKIITIDTYEDYNILSIFIHECLHEIYPQIEKPQDDYIIQMLENYVLSHLSPLQAKRLIILLADNLSTNNGKRGDKR